MDVVTRPAGLEEAFERAFGDPGGDLRAFQAAVERATDSRAVTALARAWLGKLMESETFDYHAVRVFAALGHAKPLLAHAAFMDVLSAPERLGSLQVTNIARLLAGLDCDRLMRKAGYGGTTVRGQMLYDLVVAFKIQDGAPTGGLQLGATRLRAADPRWRAKLIAVTDIAEPALMAGLTRAAPPAVARRAASGQG